MIHIVVCLDIICITGHAGEGSPSHDLVCAACIHAGADLCSVSGGADGRTITQRHCARRGVCQI